MKKIFSFFHFLAHIFSYLFLIVVYSVLYLFRQLALKKTKFNPAVLKLENFIEKIDKPKNQRIARIELIDLAMQNMKAKKTRTMIAVGGMTIGISAIVFLVSIGYGLQSLVIKRVARLEEMRQVDVSTQPGSNLFLNDEVLVTLQSFNNVKLVLPQISVVGKVNFNNSSTDMAVYGVTRDYLEQSAISPVVGRVFESNKTMVVSSKALSAKKIVVNDDDLADEGEVTATRSANKLIVTESEVGQLDNWVEVEGESDTIQTLQVSKVVLDNSFTDLEAVVNRSFLKVLDIDEAEAVGQTFEVIFIATGKLLGPNKNRIESMPVTYTIVGVTPDERTPLFFIPFAHLKSLGLDNYSQLKIVADKEQNLPGIRQKIEAQGFSTSSVSDTVEQINNLFATARTVLALLGMVALCVAALGMFNTLTVSLLERTREIGLLKAMGMRNDEVKDLFLAESMIMGSLGGILGLILGLAIGKVIEFILSIIALVGGAGMISIVSIPPLFAIMIVVLSFLVGVLTGLYPASRATKISALNALRYE